jgi:hypothetical protein
MSYRQVILWWLKFILSKVESPNSLSNMKWSALKLYAQKLYPHKHQKKKKKKDLAGRIYIFVHLFITTIEEKV